MVSVLGGLIFLVLLYGIAQFFLQDRRAAILVTVVCLFSPFFIVYFRRVRMYAVFVPFFLYLYYLTYQILIEKKYRPAFLYKNHNWTKKYLNYNWLKVLLFLLLLYIGIPLHMLTLMLFPALLPLVLYLFFIKKEKRLLPILVLGVLGLFAVQFPHLNNWIEDRFTWFGTYRPAYFDYLLGFPFSVAFSLAILTTGLLWMYFAKKKERIVALYSLFLITPVFYVFIINFPTHFRYILHFLPLSYMLTIGILIKITSLMPQQWQQYVVWMAVVLISMANFSSNWENIYRKHTEAQFTKRAYATIQQNIKPKNEAILSLYFSKLNMQGFGRQIPLLSIPNKKQYSVPLLQRDLQKHQGTWVTWATHKSYHFRQEVLNYIGNNCKKYHGYGIDDTLVEVYYCR